MLYLTTDDIVDPTALPGFLDQISDPVTKFIADGAQSRDLPDTRFGANLQVIILPSKTAIISPQAGCNPSVRDRHIAPIQACGRLAWQKVTGYNLYSRGATQMGRWKTVIRQNSKRRTLATRKQKLRSASAFSTE